MFRHASAVVLVVVLNPSWLCAQAAELTVNVSATTVYKAPSTGSIVIGEAGRGTVLAVTREVGDWVKIAWPADKDGIGYVRLSAGTLSGHPAPAAFAPAPATPAVPPSTVETAAQAQRTVPGVGNHRTEYVTAPAHVVGVGGLIGGARLGFGVTGRAWLQNRIGVQMEVSRVLEYGRRRAESPDVDAPCPRRSVCVARSPQRLRVAPALRWCGHDPPAADAEGRRDERSRDRIRKQIGPPRPGRRRDDVFEHAQFRAQRRRGLRVAQVDLRRRRRRRTRVLDLRALVRKVARPTRRRCGVSIEETCQGWALSRSFATSWPAPGSARRCPIPSLCGSR